MVNILKSLFSLLVGSLLSMSIVNTGLGSKPWEDEALYQGKVVSLSGIISPLTDYTPINYQAYGYAADHLRHNRELEELDLSRNRIDTESMKILFPDLQGKPLRKINLHDCQIDSYTCLIFSTEILQGNQILQYLDLSRNTFESWPVVSICENITHNTTLSFLNLSENDLSSNIAYHFHDVFEHNTGLQTLKLSKVGLDYHAVGDMVDDLGKNKTLKELDLSNNSIGDYGGLSIARLLRTNKGIETLDISNCSIGDRGLKAIGSALTNNKTVQKLIFPQAGLDLERARTFFAESIKNKSFLFDTKTFEVIRHQVQK
jgi:Ran GTPase-activating protein (RanGAP) involved in mRNA processing and transport